MYRVNNNQQHEIHTQLKSDKDKDKEPGKDEQLQKKHTISKFSKF